MTESVAASSPAYPGISAVRPKSSRRKVADGRYRASQSVRLPANGLATARAPRQNRNVSTTIGAVPDPYADKEAIAVTVNRRVDLLEWEYSHGHLSEAAYRTGRIVQAVFERASGRSQSSWSLGDRVDAGMAKELQLLTALEKAETITAMMARIVKAIGQIGARFLRELLGEGRTYAQVAAMRGQSGDKAVTFVAKRFRNLLEDLSVEWAAKGQHRN